MIPTFRRQTRRFPANLALACIGLVSPAAQADIVFTATLNGANERPTPNGSPATGLATVTYETAANDFRYVASFAGLSSPATAGHIHFGGPNIAGPVVLPFAGIPAATSGTVSGVLTDADIANASAGSTIAQIAQQGLLGNLYVNFHNAVFPVGEIRGQLAAASAAVSLPGTSALMGVAMLGLGLAMRRRPG